MITAVALPLEAVRRLAGRSAAEVYRFLFEHSSMDTINRIYNTSNWSVKGISGELYMHRDTVARAFSCIVSRPEVKELLETGSIHISPGG